MAPNTTPLLALTLTLALTLFTPPAFSECFDATGVSVVWDEFSECANTASCCALNRSNPPGGDYESGKPRDECLPNGLCQWRGRYQGVAFTQYFRNFCQYDDWSDGRCVNECTEPGPNGENMSQLTPCDGTNTSEKWCCGNSTSCCEGSGAIVIPQTLAAFQETSTATTTRSRSRATNSATATGASSSSQNGDGSSGKSGGLSTGAKAGIGVGAAVGALLLLGLGFFLAKVRQWKRASDAAKQNEGPAVNNPNQTYAPAPVWKEHAPMQNPAGTVVHGHEVTGSGLNEAPNQEWLKQRNELP